VVFRSADDGATGIELWRSDEKVVATSVVRDIRRDARCRFQVAVFC
jgi:ELWxxDGT repeat protein